MGSWCNGQLVVWAFIVILLLSSLWFIWNNSFCHQIPACYSSTASNIRNLPISTGLLYNKQVKQLSTVFVQSLWYLICWLLLVLLIILSLDYVQTNLCFVKICCPQNFFFFAGLELTFIWQYEHEIKVSWVTWRQLAVSSNPVRCGVGIVELL